MKKKILFVITKSNFGGAQKYVFDLATGLPKDQFDVAVALGGSGILIQKLQAENIRVLPIFSLARDVNPLSDITTFFELWRMFRKEKPDVAHLNSAKAGG
ncbi:MAG: glycosyltransferase family 1 protein, partial [Candidatus Yonathbacteria bacterium CG10_big_fil_rev_8_21_14_0_10_43_136]